MFGANSLLRRNQLDTILRALCGFGLIFLVFGCGKPAEQPAPPQNPLTAPISFKAHGDNPWGVSNSDRSASTPALLWNGQIGLRIGPDGQPLQAADSTLPFFRIDRYQQSGEEKILESRSPLDVRIQVEDQTVGGPEVSNWKQSLDFRDGVLNLSWNQTLGGSEASVKVATVVDPDYRRIFQKWTISGVDGKPVQASILNLPPENRNPSMSRNIGDGIAHWTSTQQTLVVTWTRCGDVKWEKSDQFEILKGVAGEEVQFMVAISLDGDKAEDLPDQMEEAISGWTSLSQIDIEIDGPVDDQQAIRSFLFYLRGAIHPKGKMSVSPLGLSNQMYNGHVFWDADVWVFPALALLEPERAKAIIDYRIRLQQAASNNFLEMRSWALRPPPGLISRVEEEKKRLSEGPIQYPWESSVSGLETAVGDSRQQHHITATVNFALQKAASLGLADAAAVKENTRRGFEFYLSRSEKNADGTFSLKQTMSPDEFRTIDNDLYTNVAINFMAESLGRPERWRLPKDETSFLNYEDDRLRGYKQAAGVLAVYPLQDPAVEVQAAKILERFRGGITPNGPAMTDSVHALIEARLGQIDEAYETWRKSWREFTNHPLLLFSEKRRKEVTYFTTGAGGCLQTVLFGFAGMRIDSKAQEGSKWTAPLKNGRVLSCKPNLPKAWKSMTIRGLKVLGKSYTVTVGGDGSVVANSGE